MKDTSARAAVERAEPHVARLGVVVARAVVHDRQAQQVAVEGDRPLQVARRSRSRGAARAAACASARSPCGPQPSCAGRKARRSGDEAGGEDGAPPATGIATARGAGEEQRRRPRSTAGTPASSSACERWPVKCSRSAVSSPPSEPSAMPQTSSTRPPGSSPRIRPQTSSTSPIRTHSSTSGNGCQGARGRSPARGAARGAAGRARAAAAARRRRACGCGAPSGRSPG